MTEAAVHLFKSNMGAVGRSVLERLAAGGHAAYFVGGCVRDSLLGRPVKDIDIATSALPDEVMSIFPHAVPTGLQHGTVTITIDGFQFEVTTFRAEDAYTDGRRPDSVRFLSDIEGDLERRDFTMNAMALGLQGGLVDPHGGREDLAARVLRCVGDPAHRFEEDALRMLRCVRFAAEYSLAVEAATWREATLGAPGLSRIAMERVRMELERMVSGLHPYRAMRLLAESGLLRWCKTRLRLPRTLGLAMEDEDPLCALDAVPDWEARFALWLDRMKLTPQEAQYAFDALRFSKQSTAAVLNVFRLHRAVAKAEAVYARTAFVTAVLQWGTIAAERWLALARVLCSNEAYRWMEPYAADGERWLRGMDAKELGELAIDGRQLMAASQRSGGPWVKEVLQRLLREVALGRLANDTDTLVRRAAQLWNEGEELDERKE